MSVGVASIVLVMALALALPSLQHRYELITIDEHGEVRFGIAYVSKAFVWLCVALMSALRAVIPFAVLRFRMRTRI